MNLHVNGACQGAPMRDQSSNPRHEYTYSGEQFPDPSQSHLSASPATKSEPRGTIGWRAHYLRRRTLALFLIAFAGCIIILQALLAGSDKHNGLGASQERLHYLWTYGPTAFLTLLAAFWARVVCQAKLVAPWVNMSKGPAEAKRSILLDYLSVWQPISIIKAIRHMDYSVAAASTNLILIKILIVISTALITLSPVQVSRSQIPLLVESEFVDSAAGFQDAALAYYTFRGLVDLKTTENDGFTTNTAYQLVRAVLPETTQFTTTVDGFSGGLDCEDAEVGLIASRRGVINQTDSVRLDMSLKSANCQMQTKFMGPSAAGQLGVPQNFYRFGPGTCVGASTSKDDLRVAVVLSAINYTNMTLVQHVTQPAVQDLYNITSHLLQSRAFVCKPTYSIRPVEIQKNDTQTNVTIAQDSTSRQLSQVHAWDVMTTHFNSFSNLLNEDSRASSTANSVINNTGIPVDVDGPMRLALEFAGMTGGFPDANSILEKSRALQMITAYYEQYAALIAHTMLTRTSSEPAEGSAYVTEDRLIVRALAAHLMTGFLILSIVLALVVLLVQPRHLVLPRSPSAPVNVAALLVQSRFLIDSISNMGAASKGNLRELFSCWEYQTQIDEQGCFVVHSNQRLPTNDDLEMRSSERHRAHPKTLHPLLRLSVYILIFGAISTLEVTLHISRAKDGLGDIGDESLIHYLWTTMPALVLTIFGMYFAGVDFDVKSLTPYANLRRGAPFHTSLGLDLVNRFTLPTIFKEFQTRSYAALACTVAVALTSFLTIFTSSLFCATSVPALLSAQVDSHSLIYNGVADSTGDPEGQGILAASLIFTSNLSYPAFTYEDLVFPEMDLDLTATSNDLESYNTSGFIVNATVTAVRSRLSCKMYESTQIHANITMGHNITRVTPIPSENTTFSTTYFNPLSISIDGENCGLPSDTGVNAVVGTGTTSGSPAEGYFGNGDATISTLLIAGCSDFVYVWGRWALASNESRVSDLSTYAMGCNESLESVDVAATFFGADLRIDPNYPPIPDERTTKSISTPPDDSSIYYRLAPLNGNSTFDNFFKIATSSRYAIPIASLGDDSQKFVVADSIRFHHRIIRAQIASSSYRGPVNPRQGERAADMEVVGSLNETLTHPATITDTSTRRRVVQDPVSTRIIEALLGATLVCSIIGWVLMRETNVLPRSPTSIGSVAALLADGNLFEYLPPDAAWLTKEELARVFGKDAVFSLGWGPGHEGSGERFAIYVEPGSMADEKEYTSDEKSSTTSSSAQELSVFGTAVGIHGQAPNQWQGHLRNVEHSHVPDHEQAANKRRDVSRSSRPHEDNDMEEIPVSPISSMLPIQTWDDAWGQEQKRHV
ncbi:hypothetical protein SUNI508_05561 [Seiridium unicorne]|uniref:Uncharacterized protein n=1 Tax=Seiridium unicorne TaxID=138068 RepID=A0ABR2V532_9PEZI